MRCPRWIACMLMVVVLGVARNARADDPITANGSSGSPYRLRLPYELAFLALGGAGALIHVTGHPPATCPQPCVPPRNQLAIDDYATGLRSPTAVVAANVLLTTVLVVPIIVDAVDSRFEGWGEDMVVMLESVVLSTGLTQVIKSATDRRAPVVYSSSATESDLRAADAERSFPSGHTSSAFAMAASYAITFWKRHPESAWRFVVLAAGETLALTTGLLTISAGWHYPTDVAAGALIGSGVGVLMPFLHSDW